MSAYDSTLLWLWVHFWPTCPVFTCHFIVGWKLDLAPLMRCTALYACRLVHFRGVWFFLLSPDNSTAPLTCSAVMHVRECELVEIMKKVWMLTVPCYAPPFHPPPPTHGLTQFSFLGGLFWKMVGAIRGMVLGASNYFSKSIYFLFFSGFKFHSSKSSIPKSNGISALVIIL
jgi:hypothetical protein